MRDFDQIQTPVLDAVSATPLDGRDNIVGAKTACYPQSVAASINQLDSIRVVEEPLPLDFGPTVVFTMMGITIVEVDDDALKKKWLESDFAEKHRAPAGPKVALSIFREGN